MNNDYVKEVITRGKRLNSVIQTALNAATIITAKRNVSIVDKLCVNYKMD